MSHFTARSLSVALAAVCLAAPGLHASTVTYQDGANVVSSDGLINITDYAGTRDTSLVQESANYNYGGRSTLLVGVLGSGRVRSGLIGFDVTSLAGKYTTINSVSLSLYVVSNAGSETVSADLECEGNADWVEGTTNFATQTGSADWNYAQHNTGAWLGGSAGARSASDLYGILGTSATLTTSGTGAPGTWVTITFSGIAGQTSVDTLTKIIDLWSSSGGANNAGVLLTYGNNSGNPQWQFASSEDATVADRPQLVIDYTAAAVPAPTAALGGMMLLGLVGLTSRRRRSA